MSMSRRSNNIDAVNPLIACLVVANIITVT
jgi:hypothetical protein